HDDIGIMLHYNGSSWQEIRWNTSLPFLVDVWGSGPDDVFVVGYGGKVLHYDGSVWQAMVSGTAAGLFSVWGTGPDDVYAAGENGPLLHYDGRGWLPMRSGTAANFYGIWDDPSSKALIFVG